VNKTLLLIGLDKSNTVINHTDIKRPIHFRALYLNTDKVPNCVNFKKINQIKIKKQPIGFWHNGCSHVAVKNETT